MDDLFQSIFKVFQRAFDEDILPLPEKLQGLSDNVNKLSNFQIDWTGKGILDWINRLQNLAGGNEAKDTLLVRALQIQSPRFAELLTFIGVFNFKYNGTGVESLSINWNKLDNLISIPGPTAGELDWWLSKIQKIEDVKLMQSYVSLLVFAPDELLKLEYKGEGFAALPCPADPNIRLPDLNDLINLINSPLGIGIPISLPLTLSEFENKANQEGSNGSYKLWALIKTISSKESL